MDNVSGYVDYFRQLAVSHNLLRHDPATETGDSEIKKKRFAYLGNNEIINGLGGNKLSFPALCIELYELETSSESVYDVRQRPKGSFMVVDHAEDTFPDMLRAYGTAEGIVYDLLKKIWQDHYGPEHDRCQTPFKEFRWNLKITPTGKLFENEYGYYVQFEFDLQNTINISKAPADGTFI